jgi:hypothetical protein
MDNNQAPYCFSCGMYIKRKNLEKHYKSELHEEIEKYRNLLNYHLDKVLFIKNQIDTIIHGNYK